MGFLGNKRRLVGSALALFVALQFVPVVRDNPPVKSDIPSPAEIKTVLRHACYDCHSNETVWPWYAYVAPVSWLIVYDVHEARSEMNFSMWRDYRLDKREDFLEEVLKEVEADSMPPLEYRVLHPKTSLRDPELEALRAWIASGAPESGATIQPTP